MCRPPPPHWFPAAAQSFSDLIAEYQQEYTNCFHRLFKVYVGLPFPFDTFSQVRVPRTAVQLRSHAHTA